MEKKKASPSHQKEADGLSPVNIDDIESSAVALYNNDRQKVVSILESSSVMHSELTTCKL